MLPVILSFSISLTIFALMRLAYDKNISILKKFIFVPARKSETGAIQLGGLAVSVAVMMSLEFVDPSLHSRELDFWKISALIIIIYGYLDDKFELRPFVKVFFQFCSIFFISYHGARLAGVEYMILGFIAIFFWGFGTLNGSNLIDGLDTITIKFSLGQYVIYFFLFQYIGFLPSYTFLALMAAPLLSFYLYNKYPSKIHLGEIGGVFIGMTYLFLSFLLFKHAPEHWSVENRAALAFLPLNGCMVEVGVSFLRRLLNRRTPFSGDKLHIHHLLKNKYNHSVTRSASIVSAINLASFGLCYFILSHSPLLAFIVSIIFLVSVQAIIGNKHWLTSTFIDINAHSLFNYLRKKDVTIIESRKLDDFIFEVVSDGDSHNEVLEKCFNDPKVST